MSESTLHTGTHRLTDLPGVKHPFVCQKCGGSNTARHGNGLMRVSMARWQEHDHHDKPETRLIVLCGKCAKEIIGPHPRLYEPLQPNAPWPGCMEICVDCRFRDGVSCTHPDAKVNGGTGVMLTVAAPSNAFVDGCRRRGLIQMWPSPPSACKQKEAVK